MADTDGYPALPFDRPGALHVPPQYMQLQAEGPITRVRTLTGDLAWLVTRHQDVRALFAHPALGRSHPHPDRAARFIDGMLLGGPIGNSETEKSDHTRMRVALSKSFSPRQVEGLRPRVQSLVDELLTELGSRAVPADLHEALCLPLPVRVICELLDVPYSDRETFCHWCDGAIAIDDPSLAWESLGHLSAYMGALVDRRRRDPGEDVISDMIESDKDGGLSNEEIVQLAVALLMAGHETTVARLDFGILMLLTNPEQRETMQRDPSLVPQTVEEILRMTVPGLGLIPRYASADIVVGETTIPAGDLVLLCHGAANRDPRAFPDAGRFDVTRTANPHVAFGHGPRICVGAGLARLELQCAIDTLFRRFPALELAVRPDELRLRSHVFTGGLVSLPVRW